MCPYKYVQIFSFFFFYLYRKHSRILYRLPKKFAAIGGWSQGFFSSSKSMGGG